MKAILKKFLMNLSLNTWFKKKSVHIFISCVILFIILHMTYSMTIFSYPYDYEIGDTVSEAIVLEEDYLDIEATQILKDKIQYEIDEIFALDPKIYADARESIGDFYTKAYDIRGEYDEEDIRLRVFSYLLRNSFGLNEEELKILGAQTDVDLRLTENYVYDVLQNILKAEVTDENIIQKRQEASAYFNNIDQINDDVKPVVKKIVDFHIVPNSYLDEEATNQAIKTAQDNIEDVILPAGTVLVEAGNVLDESHYTIINALGLNDLHTFEQNIPLLSMDGLVIILIMAMYFIIHFYVKRLNKSIKSIYLDFTILTLTYLLAFGLRSISIYLIPIATVAMLISIVDDFTSGIIFSVFATLLFGTIFSLPAPVIALTMIGCMISAVLVNKVHQRGKIFVAGLMVSLIHGLIVFGYLLIVNTFSVDHLDHVLMGILSGLLCSIITIGSLPLWESVFRVLTPLKLLELSNPNHPLMKRLLMEAPGTYHHSILVANLSEAAVHDIGGNAILARVGAYFHDVGKLDKPYFFVENQFDNNPHDQLVPMVSAKIIKEHVEKGLILGKQYKLHKEVLSFIEEHHGTTMIKYFYHKANECKETLEIDPKGYTYEGPVPQSKETAVVMLADSVEAAVRSMKQGDVKGLISKIIDDKIKSHQLDDSGLTFGEIEIIKQSFYSNLSSAFHERVEYPEEQTHINVIK